MEKLIGSWKLTEAGDPDTMENYMKSAELSWVFRQMVRRASPVLRIKESSKEPGKYVLIFKSKGLVNLRFSIGPFENGGEGVPERRIDGVMFNTKFWIDDDGKLSHISSHSEGTLPDMTGSREIDSDDRLKATGICCGYTVVQFCERVPDEDDETDSKL